MNVSKKTLIIFAIEILFCFIVCLPIGFFTTKAPSLEVSSASSYKILKTLILFFDFFPAIFATSIAIGFSWGFGRENVHFTTRFSHEASKYLVHIVIFSLASASLCFIAKEILVPITQYHTEKMVTDSRNLSNYIELANKLYQEERYNEASFYAKQAIQLNKKHKEANELNSKIEAKLAEPKNAIFDIQYGDEYSTSENHNINSVVNEYENKEMMNATELIKLAQECFAHEDFINAHYYANQALELCSPQESNFTLASRLANESWSNLSRTKAFDDEVSSEVFAKKKEAYAALISGDYSKAYYNFSDLIQKYPRDYDIKKYYEESKEKLSSRCFFIDETEGMQKFEQFNNIYFSTENTYGGKDIVYIEGLTSIKNTDKMVMYLRGFSIISYDKNNIPIFKMAVPTAKLIPAPIENMDSATQKAVNKNYKTKLVPYVFLKSVDRKDKNIFIEPEYEYYTSKRVEIDTIYVIPLSFEQFNTLCEISRGEDKSNILTLISFAKNASSFGFSNEILAHSFLSRTMYPLLLFICFLLCGVIAWQTRLLTTESFHFAWIILFPFLTIIAYTMIKVIEYFCDLLFYALFAMSGFFAILIAFVFFILLAILFCIRFVSMHD